MPDARHDVGRSFLPLGLREEEVGDDEEIGEDADVDNVDNVVPVPDGFEGDRVDPRVQAEGNRTKEYPEGHALGSQRETEDLDGVREVEGSPGNVVELKS